MKDTINKQKFILLLFYIIPFANQYEIMNISNLGKLELSFGKTYKVVRFNCTPYFKNDSRPIYLLFRNRWDVWGNLFVYYNISKLKIWYREGRPYIGDGYDFKKSLMNLDKYSFTAKENIGYLVFEAFQSTMDSFTLIYYHMNSYLNLSNYNNYDFSFPYTGFHFTFSYKVDKTKLNKIVSFEYDDNHVVKTYLYDKNKTTLKTTTKIYGGFSFLKYGIDEFFIKIEVSKGGSFNVNLRLDGAPDLYELTYQNNTLNFAKILYSSYYFFIDIKKAPENIVYFLTNSSGIKDSDVPYYFTNITDIEEFNTEFVYRLKKTRKHVDGWAYIYDKKKFNLPLHLNYKKLIFMINTKVDISDFFVKSIFFSSTQILNNQNYDFILTKTKPYYIFNYKQYHYYNNSLNGFIYLLVNNPDQDCSLYVYNDLADINLDNIRNNSGNLVEKNWRSYKYTSGEFYFLISNFKLSSDKTYTILLRNNNEYMDISDYMKNNNSNYTISMKFNSTLEQYLTFSIKPNNNCYIYFNITPSNLKTNIRTLTPKNEEINPIDDKYYLINKTDNIKFKILFTSNETFSEYKVVIQRISELPVNYIKITIIIIIIIAVIQIVLFIGYFIYFMRNKNIEIHNLNKELLNFN